MKTAAVIAEYNPFHKGHEYQLRRIREDSGADFIVVIMSGDFVQRGAPAVIDKYQRTRSALYGGADLVLELPAAAALGSAGDFAGTAVQILDGLGIVDELWFGSEAGDPSVLGAAAEVIAAEPEPYGQVLREWLARGLSYPAAQSRAVGAVFQKRSSEFSDLRPDHRSSDAIAVLKMPNDLLAVAYLCSLIRTDSRILPKVLKRTGGEYHSQGDAEAEWSAEAVRENLYGGRFFNAGRPLPEYSAKVLREEEDRGRLLFPDDFSDAVLYKIREEDKNRLAGYAGVTEDLANRMKKLCFSYHTVSSFAGALKTKNVTRTRIDRALFCVLLDIRKGDAKRAAQTDRVRVLGFRRGAERLIKEAAGKCRIRPTIGAKNMPEWYETDVFASNLCEALRAKRSGSQFHHDFTKNVIKL
jgi:predicted nucleotidyltransferase